MHGHGEEASNGTEGIGGGGCPAGCSCGVCDLLVYTTSILIS